MEQSTSWDVWSIECFLTFLGWPCWCYVGCFSYIISGVKVSGCSGWVLIEATSVFFFEGAKEYLESMYCTYVKLVAQPAREELARVACCTTVCPYSKIEKYFGFISLPRAVHSLTLAHPSIRGPRTAVDSQILGTLDLNISRCS